MGESSARAFINILGSSFFRPTALRSIFLIFKNFFLLQYKAAILPGRVPVSRADHILDKKIPFRPDKVEIYLDFIHFFIRTQDLLITHFRKKPGFIELEKKNIASLGEIYKMAAEVYTKNFSTTNRPRYLSRFRFLVIHLFDPHLMCIPSLHVMAVILTYTRLRKTLAELGKEAAFAQQIEAARRHALAITEAVLYVKQHSINCIPAAMYTMTRYDNTFTPSEAELFAREIFANADDISKKDAEDLQAHVISSYKNYLEQGKTSPSWEKPLLDFLAVLPKKDKSH